MIVVAADRSLMRTGPRPDVSGMRRPSTGAIWVYLTDHGNHGVLLKDGRNCRDRWYLSCG